MLIASEAQVKESGNELTPKLLAAGSFRRSLMKEPLAQKCLQRLNRSVFALSCELAAAIERHAEQLLRDRIDNHVSGAGIEGDYILR